MSPSQDTNNDSIVDVLVVGGGPVGLLLALLCSRYGLKVRIVEKQTERMPWSKAFGIHARTFEHLKRLGVTSVIDKAMKADKLVLSVGGGRGKEEEKEEVVLDFGELTGTDFRFVGLLSQQRTEGYLEEVLKGEGGRVERGVELKDISVMKAAPPTGGNGSSSPEASSSLTTVKLQHLDGSMEAVSARFVVGCDGAHSTTRHLLRLPFQGSQYKETLLLADVHLKGRGLERLDGDHKGFTRVRLFLGDGSRVVAVFPLEPALYRLVARRIPARDNGEEARVDEFQSLLDEHLPGLAIEGQPAWITAFRLHRRMVNKYQVGRVFLAGDAAHIHSPAGGQGLNLGLQDAVNLAWKLSLVSKGWARDPDSMLHSYGIERIPIARGVLTMTNRMMIFIGIGGWSPLLRRVFLRLFPSVVTRFRSLRLSLMGTMSQLLMNYQHSNSPLVQEDRCWWSWLWPFSSAAAGPKAGWRLPDYPITATGSTTSTSSTLLLLTSQGLRHTLLLFLPAQVPAFSLTAITTTIMTTLQLDYSRVLHICAVYCSSSSSSSSSSPPPTSPWREQLVSVVDETATASPEVFEAMGVGKQQGAVYLIRPDGYVAYRSVRGVGVGLDGVKHYLQRNFVPAGKVKGE